MNFLDLLSQSSISFNSKPSKKTKIKQQLVLSVFEKNINVICQFLHEQQIRQLKLVCRDLWTGIKLGVAQQKVIDYDDYQFVEEQPKQISKEDKKIRIHSLKKNNQSNTKKVVRQPSNIKQKKIMLSTLNSEFQFRNTQIGFKRLLKTSNNNNHPKHSNLDINDDKNSRLIQYIKIPNQYAISDLLINAKDSWTKNIYRANNLITLVRKWNQYHTRFLAILKRPDTQLMSLFKKLIKLDNQLSQYSQLTSSEPYCSLIILLEGAEKNLLIQDQLNKYGRIFRQFHHRLIKVIQKKQIQKTINKVHTLYQRINDSSKQASIKQSDWIQGLGLIDQSMQNLIQSQFQIKPFLQASVLNIFCQLIQSWNKKTVIIRQSQFNLNQVTMTFIIQNSQFCELCFEMLFNVNSKLSNLHSSIQKTQTNTNNIIPLKNSLNNKFRSLSGICWNISKYIKKLIKQLQVKQKKNKEVQKIKILKVFLQNEKQIDIPFWSIQNIEVTQKFYKDFKDKIEWLKQQMLKE